jgi:ribonucleotide reductase beta subunit family protein with ferritin-like domain
MSTRTLTPTDLMRRYLEQRKAVKAGNRDEVYHMHATAKIINAVFEMTKSYEQLEAWCETALEEGAQP